MTDFDKRLEQAIDRGQQARAQAGDAQGKKHASEEDLRAIHSTLRLAISEHIEGCLRKLCDHFPGFDYSTVMNEDGWGARISRDDLNLQGGASNRNLYSRLEMLVKSFSSAHILEIATKGAIRNKEAVTRNNFKFLKEATEDDLKQIVDNLVIEYAQEYSATS